MESPYAGYGAPALFWHCLVRTPKLIVESLKSLQGFIELIAFAFLLSHRSFMESYPKLIHYWDGLSPWWSLAPLVALLFQGWLHESAKLIDYERTARQEAEMTLAKLQTARFGDVELANFLDRGRELFNNPPRDDDTMAWVQSIRQWIDDTEACLEAISPKKAAIFRSVTPVSKTAEWSAGITQMDWRSHVAARLKKLEEAMRP